MDHGEPVNIRDHSGEKRGTIERKNGNLYRFLESFDCKKEINSYKEYFFTNEGVVLRTYARDFFKNGKDYESETKFKYIDGA